MTKIDVGDSVWFLKSMRMCEVVEIHDDGYTVRVLDSGKDLFATESGIELIQKGFNMFNKTEEG